MKKQGRERIEGQQSQGFYSYSLSLSLCLSFYPLPLSLSLQFDLPFVQIQRVKEFKFREVLRTPERAEEEESLVQVRHTP